MNRTATRIAGRNRQDAEPKAARAQPRTRARPRPSRAHWMALRTLGQSAPAFLSTVQAAGVKVRKALGDWNSDLGVVRCQAVTLSGTSVSTFVNGAGGVVMGNETPRALAAQMFERAERSTVAQTTSPYPGKGLREERLWSPRGAAAALCAQSPEPSPGRNELPLPNRWGRFHSTPANPPAKGKSTVGPFSVCSGWSWNFLTSFAGPVSCNCNPGVRQKDRI